MALDGRRTTEVFIGRDATVQTYLLMRKNVEVAEFRWDPRSNKVLKPCRAISMQNMPFGCLNSGGTFNSKSLSIWLKDRSIPALRPDVMERLHNLGIANTTELLSISLGLSLSDQYWVRPCDSDLRWDEVNISPMASPACSASSFFRTTVILFPNWSGWHRAPTPFSGTPPTRPSMETSRRPG